MSEEIGAWLDGWRERVEQSAPCSATHNSSPFVALIVYHALIERPGERHHVWIGPVSGDPGRSPEVQERASTLLEYTPDPLGDWGGGRYDRLARAELASVGLRP